MPLPSWFFFGLWRSSACKILTQHTVTMCLPLDFFGGFFTFFALEDFGVFFCTFGVVFDGVDGFFFFLGGYYIQQIPQVQNSSHFHHIFKTRNFLLAAEELMHIFIVQPTLRPIIWAICNYSHWDASQHDGHPFLCGWRHLVNNSAWSPACVKRSDPTCQGMAVILSL